MHQPRDRCQEEKFAFVKTRWKCPVLMARTLARAQSGGEILDQCANERNENDQGSPPIGITGASELSLCKELAPI